MLKQKIEDDLRAALKAKDDIRVSTLRLLKAALLNAEIAKKQEIGDEEIILLIKKQLKQRRDSIEGFKKGGRQDLVDKETKEFEILKAYLPDELDPDEMLAIVKEAISESGASSPNDMGKAMKQAMAKIKGRADGNAVSAMVKNILFKEDKDSA
ncbi:MAG: GatB/YqeY domain-containing protein [Candidatus Omnitrophota bacterium]